MEQQPIEVFFSYSREDKPLRDKLEKHLISLKRQGVISLWYDRQIVAGSEWEEEIDRHLRSADIILLLISPDFVASKYCYEIELPDAMARHEAGEAFVVPILLRPVAGWKNLPFAKLQLYPSGGVPVTRWGNEDDAFVDVAEGIEAAVEQLLERREQREAERLSIRQNTERQGEEERQRLEVATRKVEKARLVENRIQETKRLQLEEQRQLEEQQRLEQTKTAQQKPLSSTTEMSSLNSYPSVKSLHEPDSFYVESGLRGRNQQRKSGITTWGGLLGIITGFALLGTLLHLSSADLWVWVKNTTGGWAWAWAWAWVLSGDKVGRGVWGIRDKHELGIWTWILNFILPVVTGWAGTQIAIETMYYVADRAYVNAVGAQIGLGIGIGYASVIISAVKLLNSFNRLQTFVILCGCSVTGLGLGFLQR